MKNNKNKPRIAKLELLFLSVLLLSTQLCVAQLSEKYSNYEANRHEGLAYGLFKPANYDPQKAYPLLVYLHGSTDTVSRDIQWYNEAFQKENPCFVVTPKSLVAEQGWGNSWNDEHSDDMSKTLDLVDSLISAYNIDEKRLYIYGISMGGFGVFSVLSKEPGKFAAAYAVCGGSSVAAAAKMLDTPLWIFHGEKDDVVPVRLSREVYEEMIRLGGKKVRYTEYPGVRHNSWENVEKEKDLPKWLFSQRLKR